METQYSGSRPVGITGVLEFAGLRVEVPVVPVPSSLADELLGVVATTRMHGLGLTLS
jgi:hypothetical protein